MNKQYNRVKAEAFFEVESIIYLVHAFSNEVVEEAKKFDFWQMFFCAEGNLRIRRDEEIIELKEHHVVFFEPRGDWRTVLRSVGEDNAEFYVVSFEGSLEKLQGFGGAPIHLYGREPMMISELCTVGRRVLQPIKMDQEKQGLCVDVKTHPIVLQYIKLLLEQFLIKIYCRLEHIDSLQNEAAKSNRVHYEKALVVRIHQFMYDHIREKISIKDIAEELGVNETTLRITYKKETGKSIMKAFNDIKMAEARRLVRETNLNFTQISDYLGFSSLYHFSRFFKEKEGVTLSEYSRLTEK